MQEKLCGIYRILCVPTGKSYIGQSINIKSRLRDHKLYLSKQEHENNYLQNSWHLYGKENFEITIVELCSIEDLNEKETYYIDFYNTLCPNGFNMDRGGSGRQDLIPEVRKKMSDARKSRVTLDSTRIKLSKAFKGKPKNAEWRNNISVAKKGKKLPKSAKTSEKISIDRQGKIRKDNTLKYIGISLEKRTKNPRWYAEITHKRKKYNLGTYSTIEEAAQAYNLAAIHYFGEDAKLNIIDPFPNYLENMTLDFDVIENGKKRITRFFGVYPEKKTGGWIAKITYNKEEIYLGYTMYEIEAAMMVNETLLDLYGYKAKLNIISEEELNSIWND